MRIRKSQIANRKSSRPLALRLKWRYARGVRLMFEGVKLWKLAGALRQPGNDQAAYAAVVEVGRIGGSRAVDLLIGALERRDGVARSAARELGRLGDERAIPPLVALLANADVSQAASDALVKLGRKAVL